MTVQKNRNIKTSLTRKTIQKVNKVTSLFLPFVFAFFLLPNLTQAQLNLRHWQSFQYSEAFDLQANWTDAIEFRHKPIPQAARFETSTVTDRYSFTNKLPSYATFNELGFFCTLDLKFDKKMKLPVRFRLGTLEEVNRKEGYFQY